MLTKHYCRKERQLKYLVKRLNILIKQTDLDLQYEIDQISNKIKYLASQLNGILSGAKMRRILGGIALLIGVSFSNSANAQWFAYPTSNPFNINSGYCQYVQSVNLVDIDGDGDLDLITDSIDYAGYYSNFESFSFQENIGSPTIPNFNTAQLNPFSLSPPVNSGAVVQMRHFVDIDGDGDYDVLANAIYNNFGFNTTYRYYENIGTSLSPQFQAHTTNPFNLQSAQGYIAFSSFGDMDNDGDYDIINILSNLTPYSSPEFSYIENTGTATAPSFGAAVSSPFNLQTFIGGVLAPKLVDLDSDGDLDILYAQEDYYSYNGSGQFIYIENIGSQTTPTFAIQVVNPFGLNGSMFDGNITIDVKDLDGDGDLDLLAGNYEGDTYYFENVGVQPPVTYECINYSCVDPGTGNGSYTTLAACQTSCIAPVSFECDGYGTCYDPGDGSGQYISLQDCQIFCTPPPTWDCVSPGNCQDPGNGFGQYISLQDCQMSCTPPPTWDCVSPGNCQDPGNGFGQYMSIQDCQNNCTAATWDCDAQGNCYDPGTGQGLYTSLAGCQSVCIVATPTWNCISPGNCQDPGNGQGIYSTLTACQSNCAINSVEDTEFNNIKLFPNPVNNTLNISTEKNILKIEIYDALGRVIISKENPSTTIDVEKIEHGIYTIAIIFENTRILKRFTK